MTQSESLSNFTFCVAQNTFFKNNHHIGTPISKYESADTGIHYL